MTTIFTIFIIIIIIIVHMYTHNSPPTHPHPHTLLPHMPRVVRKVPELLDEFTSRASSLLNDRHHGVLLTGVTLMIEICDMFPDVITEYRQHVPLLCKILKSLLMSGYAPEHDVGGLTDPFLQVKVCGMVAGGVVYMLGMVGLATAAHAHGCIMFAYNN